MFTFQVKKAFSDRFFSNIVRTVIRHCSNEPGPRELLCRLHHRSLLRVRSSIPDGAQAAGFLQGLITNDMAHLKDGKTNCMYAMFLNTKGRVLYDTLVHATPDPDTFLLECDSGVAHALRNHMSVYRLRKKIDIDDISDDLKLYSFLGRENMDMSDKELSELIVHKDPRVSALGYRIISPSTINDIQVSKTLGGKVIIGDPDEYMYERYKLGVGEGVDDLPPGSCIPLEANCDYLHGVSFHKGCYIGQELTARVHHTGIVRKRFMPIKFVDPPVSYIPADTIINEVGGTSTRVGKVKGVIKDRGLVMVNISEALRAKALAVSGHIVKITRPDWWPKEVSKEKSGVVKLS